MKLNTSVKLIYNVFSLHHFIQSFFNPVGNFTKILLVNILRILELKLTSIVVGHNRVAGFPRFNFLVVVFLVVEFLCRVEAYLFEGCVLFLVSVLLLQLLYLT